MEVSLSCQLGEKTLEIATGALACQADGAVTISCEGTVVLVTAVAAESSREGTDFLPLTVDYREKTSAAGKIPGGFFKREGRPTEKEILTCRLTDRPLRPLFPDGMRNDIQIVGWVLSADGENDPDILCINGASAALMVSGIPFAGPIGAVRIGLIDDKFVINPTISQLENSRMDLVMVGTKTSVNMVEGCADSLSEDLILQAIRTGQRALGPIIDLQNELREKVSPEPREFDLQLPSEELIHRVDDLAASELSRALSIEGKKDRNQAVSAIKENIREELLNEDAELEGWAFSAAFKAVVKKYSRRMIIEDGRRSDGRGQDEVRPISCRVGVLPRTHGSAVFNRGETQALVLTTLGTVSDRQRIDGLEEEKKKRFMLHYNFPSFCTGEARPSRGPKRREIGHGALAERSLLPVLPTEDEFPYTIRVVADILSSNGSSSMASVSGGSLALMDAGVPIKSAVAGIAMGLLKEGDRTVILTDILGSEDALGDMDFKLAGTKDGVTGLQMDIKIAGISEEIMKDALEKARKARLYILEKMNEVQSSPRPEISQYAPKILSLQIDPDKIGLVIGPKGKNIKALEKTGVKIDIEDDGFIAIASPDLDAAQKAKENIELMVAEVEVGKIYRGTVKTVKQFGAFVEILPGKDGLCHISEMADYRVKQVEDIMKEGDEVDVKVIAVDNLGRIKLSHKQIKTK
ncbi:MAG: polyribonucleotide nucleotidyltransferase [Candidatus Euphemobacter frigidus]|nr:polyribonucleotide nucleotidyltransferase [Candidatus Euphemobacter frigidus]MDP8275140.1 polyribonucleotide nucleotidyltransferase [Candidatus Euphemobacter frigidus]